LNTLRKQDVVIWYNLPAPYTNLIRLVLLSFLACIVLL